MAIQKPPAFQFYAKDFLTGTATLSLVEVGAYIRLLCYAWDSGGVPTGAADRAAILGCSRKQESALWSRISRKFILDADRDVYLNERMESERLKQADYRQRQSERGKASGEARRQPESHQRINLGSTGVHTLVQPAHEPETNSSSSSSSSSSQELKRHAHDVRFEGWWEAYPKKVGKGAALKAWSKIRPSDAVCAAMLAALDWQRNQPQWTKDGGAYVPNPQTYLNQARWQDEPFFTNAAASDEPTFDERLEAIERGERNY